MHGWPEGRLKWRKGMNAVVMRNRYTRVVAVAGARRIESDCRRGYRWKMSLMRRAR